VGGLEVQCSSWSNKDRSNKDRNFPPFNLPLFRTFARSSSDVITSAEERSRENLAALPGHVAESFRGTATTVHIRQEAHQAENREMFGTLTERLDFLTATITTLAGSKARRRDVANILSVPPVSTKPLRYSELHQRSLRQSPPQSHPASESSGDPCLHSQINTALLQSTLPQPAHSALSQPLHSTLSQPLHSTLSQPLRSTLSQPAQMQSESTVTSISVVETMTAPFVNYILSSDPALATIQGQAMQVLEACYGQTRVRNHVWNWSNSAWVPSYHRLEIASIQSIQELWDELEVGVDDHLSISELEEGWKAKWRHGDRVDDGVWYHW
ncbi:hypothetical protein EV361DRAFT_872218, partial [Lentinula raphanica]